LNGYQGVATALVACPNSDVITHFSLAGGGSWRFTLRFFFCFGRLPKYFTTFLTMDPFIGEIRLLPFPTAPRGWALCQGQLLSIAQNSALFSLLGNLYGGDGRSSFALPNLAGRAALSAGQGPGLSPYQLSATTGTPDVTLLTAQMPMHTHTLTGTMSVGSGNAGATSPAGAVFSVPAGHDEYVEAQGTTALAADLISGISAGAGGGSPHENMMPYLALNYYIALTGIFPPRS
jgi:microcystin-dependent protein